MIPCLKMHWVSEIMLQKSEIPNKGWEILILVFCNIKWQQTEGHWFFFTGHFGADFLTDGRRQQRRQKGLQASEIHSVSRYSGSLEAARFHCRPQFYPTMSFHSVRNGSWWNQTLSVHIGTRSNEEEAKVHFSVQSDQCVIGQTLVRPGPEPQLSTSDHNIATILKLRQLFNLFYFDQAA